jgi:fermentation-respiration switch protein FrsA (DUF1100 family)
MGNWNFRKFAQSVGGVLLGIPLYCLQDRMLFPRQRLHASDRLRLTQQFPNAEEIYLHAADGTALHGWLVKPANATTPCPLLIYFPGNADEVSAYISQQPRLGNCALLLMNYRGYGFTRGTPSELALFADALSIYDAMSARADIDASRIAVLGRSLGSGVAVYLASQRPVLAVILTTPFDSIRQVAQERYPHVPVRQLLRHHFDSLGKIKDVTQPALFLVAADDRVIPHHHASRLYKAWRAKKKIWLELPLTEHANIVDHPRYWETVAEFLSEVKASGRR